MINVRSFFTRGDFSKTWSPLSPRCHAVDVLLREYFSGVADLEPIRVWFLRFRYFAFDPQAIYVSLVISYIIPVDELYAKSLVYMYMEFYAHNDKVCKLTHSMEEKNNIPPGESCFIHTLLRGDANYLEEVCRQKLAHKRKAFIDELFSKN